MSQQAEVDPFFARYGLQISVEESTEIPVFDWGLRRKVNLLPRFLADNIHSKLDRFRRAHVLQRRTIKIPYGLCQQCEFLAPWHEIGYDQLSDYYAFYLQDEYKQARTAFQPNFEMLGQLMGSPEEAELRRRQHEQFMAPHLRALHQASAHADLRLLDFGGGEGLIIPSFPWIKGDVLEVESAEQPVAKDGHGYDVVQCLHVLEHVGHPQRMVQHLSRHCRTGGLLYIEVPVEYPGLERVEAGQLPVCHEHINKFCLKSVRALLTDAPVEPLLIALDEVKFLHLDGMTPVVRCLARKR
ncbi:MAG: class I SAM-dependent methyltransferase [Cyanobacteriota bacterium]